MKVVIIGGGIAGLTLGVFLRKKNYDVVINERTIGMPVRGHAFLMHTDGLSILNELNSEHRLGLPGKRLNTYSLRRPDGKEIKHLQLNSWQCIKRGELIRFLHSLFPKENFKEGRKFSHFLYEGSKAIAAVFTNGEVEYGDIFVGADGGNSKVRSIILGAVDFTPVQVKEVVGIASSQKLSQTHESIFTKYQNGNTGLAFGLIPTAGEEFVWFVQYDPAISDLQDNSPEGLEKFCKELLKKFPEDVQEILSKNDFSTSYVWDTRDFDLLPSFHKENVVLIGDAAHLALPFTSAGTTNAIVDAQTLAACLSETTKYTDAFARYYSSRADEVFKHTTLGRDLKRVFLSPLGQDDDDIPVPLIPQRSGVPAEDKLINVLYFTDPICSTCWIIQPLLRKLKLEYGNYLNIEYRMGGLLPSWEEYNKGKIQKPSDAAKHWEEVCACHEIPLDGDIWLEDPLTSSYPPSIAFKAAQMQDTDLAILFLRRIKEMVFLEKKNIIQWRFLERAAFHVGLDSARLLRDFEGKAQELFREDLKLAQDLNVTSFPTLFFYNNEGQQIAIKGFQPYEKFEEIINQLIPFVQKQTIDASPETLFEQFPTMTNKEFAFLSNISLEEASEKLAELHKQGFLDKYESKNGAIWIGRFANSPQTVIKDSSSDRC